MTYASLEPNSSQSLSSLHHHSTSSAWILLLHRLHHILRHQVTKRPTLSTLPPLLVVPKLLHRRLNLRPQVCAVKALFTNNLPTLLTIPPHAIHAPLWPRLLQHNADRIFKSDGIMRRISGQEEHAVLVDGDVDEFRGFGGWGGGVNGLEEHGAFVLEEEFGGGVYVEVGAGVGAADDHYCHADLGGLVDTIVVYGRLEEVGVFFEPVVVKQRCGQ